LKNNNLKDFGKLLIKSHTSLRDDYEVTGLELDTLFEEARRFKGCIGSRMTGAGFGGCTISLVLEDKIEDFKAVLTKAYVEETGLQPTFIVCDTGDGVKRIE
jgi:galactokinase